MSKIVIDSHGIVDKYIGDAIMAFWDSPLRVLDHQIVSCRVALQSQERLRELHLVWKQRGFPLVKMRIGVHCGSVLVGNLGSPDRLHYTCIGVNVNLASLLEGLNKVYSTEILISEDIHGYAKSRYVCRPIDFIPAAKGRKEPLLVYELVGAKELIRDEALHAIGIYNQAFESMVDGRVHEAEERFSEFLELVLDDKAAMKHLAKCREIQRRLGTP